MAAKDKFHNAVKRSLEKENWLVTHDPLRIEYAQDERVEIDLGAERILEQKKQEKKLQWKLKVF